MRERKFRGKSKETGKFVYGSYVHNRFPVIVPHGEYYSKPLIAEAMEWVDGDTIGQFTGLKDRNNREIYEGDIIRSFVPNRDEYGAIIDYNDEITVFRDVRTAPEQFVFLTEPQIIGNIYENPELMEKVNA